MLKMGNISINATSKVDGVDVAFFVASLSDEKSGNYTISKSIVNAKKYDENQDECDADYVTFEGKARELSENMQEI